MEHAGIFHCYDSLLKGKEKQPSPSRRIHRWK